MVVGKKVLYQLNKITISFDMFSGEEAATKTDAGDGVAARPVSVANQAQCCGALKSGVCNLI